MAVTLLCLHSQRIFCCRRRGQRMQNSGMSSALESIFGRDCQGNQQIRKHQMPSSLLKFNPRGEERLVEERLVCQHKA